MALKDWKKNNIEYENHTDIIFDSKKTNKGISIVYQEYEKRWRVRYFPTVGQGYTNQKYFKTKSQALKYAKAYMRKH